MKAQHLQIQRAYIYLYMYIYRHTYVNTEICIHVCLCVCVLGVLTKGRQPDSLATMAMASGMSWNALRRRRRSHPSPPHPSTATGKWQKYKTALAVSAQWSRGRENGYRGGGGVVSAPRHIIKMSIPSKSHARCQLPTAWRG